jgi:flagellar hook assembly protein FlgD
VPAPFKVTVSLYNSAGERVRLLFDGACQFQPTQIKLNGSLVLSGQVAVGASLPSAGNLIGSGTMSWDGTDDAGQAVAGGVYYFKVESIDPFGAASAVIQAVQVVNGQVQAALDVFNSAGERVRHQVLPSASQGATLTKLGSDSFAAGSQVLQIYVTQNGVATAYPWDGRNDDGEVVNSGTYSILLVQSAVAGSSVQTMTVAVIKTPGGEPGGTFKAGPNPAAAGVPLRFGFDPCPGLQVCIDLFNVAGEHVARVSGDGGGGVLTLGAQGLASGAYVADVGVWRGRARLRKERLKVALIR